MRRSEMLLSDAEFWTRFEHEDAVYKRASLERTIEAIRIAGPGGVRPELTEAILMDDMFAGSEEINLKWIDSADRVAGAYVLVGDKKFTCEWNALDYLDQQIPDTIERMISLHILADSDELPPSNSDVGYIGNGFPLVATELKESAANGSELKVGLILRDGAVTEPLTVHRWRKHR